MKVLAALLILACVYATMIPHITKKMAFTPRQYKVQIHDSPQQRWAAVIADKAPALRHLVKEYQLLPIPDFVKRGVAWWAKNIFVYQDMVRQIEAIAKLSGLEFKDIMLLNFIPELMATKMCTGALIRTIDNKIIHGRNFDIEFMRLLSPLLVTVDHYDKQKLVFTAEFVVGSSFTVTGIRHGAFAISQNARNGPAIDILLSLFVYDSIPTSYLILKTLKTELSFQSAVRALNYTQITSSGYYIISGVSDNQGAVIERDPYGAHGFYTLTKDNWYLIQTNYDRDVQDPAKDYRRTPCQLRLGNITQNRINKAVVYENIMLQWPNFNIGTILTAIMVPAEHYYNASMWYGSIIQKETLEAGLEFEGEISDTIQFLE